MCSDVIFSHPAQRVHSDFGAIPECDRVIDPAPQGRPTVPSHSVQAQGLYLHQFDPSPTRPL